jgi:hypothetical protein
MWPVSLDCPFFIAPSVFSNVNLLKIKQNLLVKERDYKATTIFVYVIKHPMPMTKSRVCNVVIDSAMINSIVISWLLLNVIHYYSKSGVNERSSSSKIINLTVNKNFRRQILTDKYSIIWNSTDQTRHSSGEIVYRKVMTGPSSNKWWIDL